MSRAGPLSRCPTITPKPRSSRTHLSPTGENDFYQVVFRLPPADDDVIKQLERRFFKPRLARAKELYMAAF